MQSKRNYKNHDDITGDGKIKFSYLKKKGKHKRAKINTTDKEI